MNDFSKHYNAVVEDLKQQRIPLVIGINTLTEGGIPNHVARKILNKLKTDVNVAYYLKQSRSRYKPAVFKYSNPSEKFDMIGKYRMFDMPSENEEYLTTSVMRRLASLTNDTEVFVRMFFQMCVLIDRCWQTNRKIWFDIDIELLSNVLQISSAEIEKLLPLLVEAKVMVKISDKYKITLSEKEYSDEINADYYKANSFFNTEEFADELTSISKAINEHVSAISNLLQQHREVSNQLAYNIESKKEQLIKEKLK